MLVKPIFEKLHRLDSKKILIAFAILAAFAIFYNIFFRYEYKIYKYGSSAKVIKLDRLTGKSVWYIPEYKEIRKEK